MSHIIPSYNAYSLYSVPKISVLGSRPLHIIDHCRYASYEPSCVKIGSVVFAVGDDKKKRKERRSSLQKVTNTLYFTYSQRSPLWADCNQISFFGRYGSRNYLCQIWCSNIKGLEIYGGSKFGISHWNCTAGHLYSSMYENIVSMKFFTLDPIHASK